MSEAERIFVGEVGLIRAHQLLANEGEQVPGDLGPHRLRRELVDGSSVKELALDGRPLDHGTLLAGEAVEPGGQEDVDGREGRPRS